MVNNSIYQTDSFQRKEARDLQGLLTIFKINGWTNVDLPILEDTLVEGIESITATISASSRGGVNTASATANIIDDDSYSIAIKKTTDGAENNDGTPMSAVFTVLE